MLLSALHKINFAGGDGGDQGGGLGFAGLVHHAALFLAIQVPLSALCLRHYILVPTTPLQRAFVLVYDSLVDLSFLRQHVLLTLFSILGARYPEFLTLELLDIASVSPVIRDIITSITGKTTELALVCVLFVITSIIYAAFGMASFHEYMTPTLFAPSTAFGGNATYSYSYGGEEDDVLGGPEVSSLTSRLLRGKGGGKATNQLDAPVCSNLLGCTFFFFHEGLGEAGNAKGQLEQLKQSHLQIPFCFINRSSHEGVQNEATRILSSLIFNLLIDTIVPLVQNRVPYSSNAWRRRLCS